MKPGGLQSLRGIQPVLAELMPGLQSLYAQDAVQTSTMLVESLAAEWDVAADELRTGNLAVRDLLGEALSIFTGRSGNEPAGGLVKQVEEAVAAPPATSVRISDLTAESEVLRAALEAVVMALEDIAAGPADAQAMVLREAIYSHLRVEAGAGWSFWDVASFRERMATLKSEHK